MLFNSVAFLFGFLPIAYVVFWTLRTTQTRYLWLAITGYVFYSYWNPWFCLLMAFSTLVSFTAGLGMLRWPAGPKRRLCLVVPIVVDLSLLGFFKYANFAAATAASASRLAGFDVRIPHLDIILPIGISFYTFHTISYIVDSYRGNIRPTRNFIEFAAYVSLFSQLVAGPIVRFRQIEADLESIGERDRTRWIRPGLALLVVGLVEKVLIADSLAAYVDPALASYHTLSTAGAWLAMLGYTFQLYFDFSGYSTMAVGLGLLFGLRIPQNFRSPYKALDPSDFWQRWHISLSSCLRDYLYIPLGGNRHGTSKTYRNLMLTMLIGGLWHGASWTFVAWGAYHGALLCSYRVFAERWDPLPPRLRQLTMLVLVLLGWVLFRATSFAMAATLIATMFHWVPGPPAPALGVTIAVFAIAAWWSMIGPGPFELRFPSTVATRVTLTAGFAAALALIITASPSPFLYFQF